MDGEARSSKKPRGDPGSGLTAFTLRLAKQLAEGDGGRKIVFSPLSIYAALALVAAGSRGATLDELLALLGAASRNELAEFARGVAERALTDRSGSGGPLVAFACGLWHEKTVALKPSYHAAAVESYMADTCAADFKNNAEKARKKINNWVSKSTNDLITEILPPGSVHSEIGIVLANAIYFMGAWSEPFSEKGTEDRPFYRLDGSHVRAPFMTRSRTDQFIKPHDGFKLLKLPYKMKYSSHHLWLEDDQSDESDEGAKFSMCIFLPDTHNGLPGLIDEMASSPSFLWDHLPRRRVEVGEFRLPKFKLSFSSEINGVLKAMGLKATFDAGKADLCDMLEGSLPLVVEHVFHKAVIEVNEKGTEATASTALTMRLCCASFSEPVDFVANHPFVFFVVEEVSSAVVFMAHVLDPTTSA
ncbi:hypothetical protein ACP70R_032088 [Stipagrostis hirtigluma subsp. patula]